MSATRWSRGLSSLNTMLLLLIPAAGLQAQQIVRDVERVSLDSPEGWAMAHTISASLNLGALPPAPVVPWQVSFSAEVSSIPHLSREEQRVGFDGFKLEDMNKSPVFGRARVQIGLPSNFSAELSWTPPLEIDGAKPEHVFGLAIQRPLFELRGWKVGGRVFALRGDGTGDVTCSRDVASESPGTAGNPFGCLDESDDSTRLDHEGLELLVSRTLDGGRWEPYAAVAYTRIHPETQVDARVFAVIDQSRLSSEGELTTFSLGLGYHFSPAWSLNTAFSYTPLDVRRPPLREQHNGDFWSLRLGLNWHPAERTEAASR